MKTISFFLGVFLTKQKKTDDNKIVVYFILFIVDQHYRDHHGYYHWIHGLGHNHHAKENQLWNILFVSFRHDDLQIQVEMIQHQLHLVYHIHHDDILVDFDQ